MMAGRHVPRHALEEVRAYYHRITEADSLAEARVAYKAFITKWSKCARPMSAIA
jgi:transposase-like protein